MDHNPPLSWTTTSKEWMPCVSLLIPPIPLASIPCALDNILRACAHSDQPACRPIESQNAPETKVAIVAWHLGMSFLDMFPGPGAIDQFSERRDGGVVQSGLQSRGVPRQPKRQERLQAVAARRESELGL